MWIRLFLFLLVLVVTMLVGVVAILMVSGTFTMGLAQSEELVMNDLTYLSTGISEHLGLLSQHAVGFSESLSASIENRLKNHGKSPSHIKYYPELLEDILSEEFERTLSWLLRSNSSGVFVILDATINPALSYAETSKAGLYIKNMEPNIVNSSTPNIHIIRGHPNIARKNMLPLHAQWEMEFDVTDASYFTLPLQASSSTKNLSLSRLYFWTTPVILPGTSEQVMLCSVPLIDSEGNPFGVCGLEISAMLFKLSYAPQNNIYSRAFSVLFCPDDNIIDLSHSLIAGGYSMRNRARNNSHLKIVKGKSSFYSYISDYEDSFLGIHTPVKLYPKDSFFSDQQWMIAIMIPRDDIVNSISRLNIMLFSLLILLLVIGIMISLYLSQRFIKPISQGIDIIKSTGFDDNTSTNIPEIDDLIEFLASQDKKLSQKAVKEPAAPSLLNEFIKNVKTLSPAEKAVFDLYVKGHTAKEIAHILSLSINTIKTHNKRIYMKLNVGSREELLLYINMIKDIGGEFK